MPINVYPCPRCHQLIGGPQPGRPDPDRPEGPTVGDIAICDVCHEILVVELGRYRLAQPSDVDPADFREPWQAEQLLEELRRRRPRPPSS